MHTSIAPDLVKYWGCFSESTVFFITVNALYSDNKNKKNYLFNTGDVWQLMETDVSHIVKNVHLTILHTSEKKKTLYEAIKILYKSTQYGKVYPSLFSL